MDISINKKNLAMWLCLVFVAPIILTVVMLFQQDENGGVVMGIIIGVVWLIAVGIACYMIKEAKGNPYPFSYLVDYETLIKYMKEEEKLSLENSLEAGFHYYFYRGNEKNEVQSWHYTFSDSEKDKGNVYYWNKEEFGSLDDLINNKIAKFDDYVLIELIDSNNSVLDDFKKNHQELDIVKFINESHIK